MLVTALLTKAIHQSEIWETWLAISRGCSYDASRVKTVAKQRCRARLKVLSRKAIVRGRFYHYDTGLAVVRNGLLHTLESAALLASQQVVTRAVILAACEEGMNADRPKGFDKPTSTEATAKCSRLHRPRSYSASLGLVEIFGRRKPQ